MPTGSYRGRPEPSPWDFDYDSVDYWSDPDYSPPYPNLVNDYWSDANYSPPRERLDALQRRYIVEEWEAALEELKAQQSAAAATPPQVPPPDINLAPTERPKPTPAPKCAPAWLEAVTACFDEVIRKKGRFGSQGDMRDAVKEELKSRRRKRPTDRTIERMLDRHRPHWFNKNKA